MSSNPKHAIGENQFESQHKIHSENKKDFKDKKAIEEWTAKSKEK